MTRRSRRNHGANRLVWGFGALSYGGEDLADIPDELSWRSLGPFVDPVL